MKSIITLFAILTYVSVVAQTKGVQIKTPSPHSGEGRGEVYAVVVGISDYQDPDIPDLRFADKDAEAFANYLRSPAGGTLDADHLKLLTNEKATMAQFAKSLDWLWEVCKEGDEAIIYFSGHGDVEKKSLTQPGFLLCWDAPARVYMAGGAFALPMLQEVISTLSTQNKAKVLIITDACHSAKLAGSEIYGAQLTGQNLARQFANEIKLLSCQPDEYSIEGEQWGGGRGAFSYYLMDALYGMADANNDLSVNLKEVGRYLEDHVTAEVAPVRQNPKVIGNPSEPIASVNANLIAELRSGKISQRQLLYPIENRGMEDDVLAGVDTSARELYWLFKQALKDKVFLEPATTCADAYYQRLMAEPKLARLHTTMTRNYAAALQDDAQQVMNTMLRTGLTPEILIYTDQTAVYRNYPAYLNRAAQLLGSEHYMYSMLMARKAYFEGKVVKNNIKKRQYYLEALQWLPDLPHAYLELGRTFGPEHLDSSEYFQKKAIEVAPSWPLAYKGLADFYEFGSKKFDKAEEVLNLALKMDSSSILIWYRMGQFHMNRGNLAFAEKCYLKTIEELGRDVCFPCVHSSLGYIYNNTGRLDEAIIQFKKAIQLDSVRSENSKSFCLKCTINLLGVAYFLGERYNEAVETFIRAIELDSSYFIAYGNLGTSYFNLNLLEEAQQAYLKSISLEPNYIDALIGMASVLAAKGKIQEALAYIEEAIHKKATFEKLENEGDLAHLRSLPEWKTFIKKHFPEKFKD